MTPASSDRKLESARSARGYEDRASPGFMLSSRAEGVIQRKTEVVLMRRSWILLPLALTLSLGAKKPKNVKPGGKTPSKK